MRRWEGTCPDCGVERLAVRDHTISQTSICSACGLAVPARDGDSGHAHKGFLARLSRFGLGIKHRPLFRDQNPGSPR